MSSLDFDDTSYEQLQAWVESGKTKGLPYDLVNYLSTLELVRSMYDKYAQKKFIVKTLMLPPYSLSEYRAHKMFSEALNFFYSNNEVKREAWANIYADKLDKLALIAIESNDYQTAEKCTMNAVKLRMGEKSNQNIPKQLLERRPIFYTIRAKDVGLPEANRAKLAQWIDKLEDIPAEERNRMHRDGMTEKAEGNVFEADITDIDFVDGK
jgi:hypothetical protein